MIKGKKHACIIKFLRKKMLFKVRFSNFVLYFFCLIRFTLS